MPVCPFANKSIHTYNIVIGVYDSGWERARSLPSPAHEACPWGRLMAGFSSWRRPTTPNPKNNNSGGNYYSCTCSSSSRRSRRPRERERESERDINDINDIYDLQRHHRHHGHKRHQPTSTISTTSTISRTSMTLKTSTISTTSTTSTFLYTTSIMAYVDRGANVTQNAFEFICRILKCNFSPNGSSILCDIFASAYSMLYFRISS